MSLDADGECFVPDNIKQKRNLKMKNSDGTKMWDLTVQVCGNNEGTFSKGGMGYILVDPHGQILGGKGKHLDGTGKHEAEYKAVIMALQNIPELMDVKIQTSSKKVYQQLIGEVKIRESQWRVLYQDVHELLQNGIRSWTIELVDKKELYLADLIATRAIGRLEVTEVKVLGMEVTLSAQFKFCYSPNK